MNSEAINALAQIQEERGVVLSHVVEGSIHEAAGAVLRGLALLCETVEDLIESRS
jgi:hypothetical protein